MAINDQQDWVDRAMAQDAWEPPDGFTDRIVLQAMTVLPGRVSFREGMAATFNGVRVSLRARLAGSAWVLRQYRDLLLHS